MLYLCTNKKSMYLGFNGENWFQAQDEVSKTWIAELINPGQSLCLRFRQDKPDSDPADIEKLIDLDEYLRSQDRMLEVIFCANVKEPAESAFSKLQQVINGGVNVVAVEFGNETYSKDQSNFDFEVYKEWFEPLYNMVKEAYVDMPCLIFLAPRPKESGVLGGRADHSRFNTVAIEYINTHAGCHPTVHIYFNSRECPTLNSRPANVVFSADGVYPEWDTFYTNVTNEAIAQIPSLWENTLTYITNSCPGKQLFITEWGFDNYGTIKNAMGPGIVAWNIWNIYGEDPRITGLCQHNGLSKASPGMIFPASPDKDLNPEGYANLKRVDYFIHALFRSRLWFKQNGEEFTPYFSTDTATFQNAEVFCIEAPQIYHGSGATAWMSKGTTPSYIVDGISYAHADAVTFDKVSIGIFRELPLFNTPPIADAGEDDTVVLPRGVTTTPYNLDASRSFDFDGDDLTFKWYLGGALVGLQTISDVVLGVGKHTFTVEVTDSRGATSTDHVTITVKKRRYFFGIPLPTFNFNFY